MEALNRKISQFEKLVKQQKVRLVEAESELLRLNRNRQESEKQAREWKEKYVRSVAVSNHHRSSPGSQKNLGFEDSVTHCRDLWAKFFQEIKRFDVMIRHQTTVVLGVHQMLEKLGEMVKKLRKEKQGIIFAKEEMEVQEFFANRKNRGRS